MAVENEWYDITLGPGWGTLDGFLGIYLHRGRVYIQGTVTTIDTAGTPGEVLGTIPSTFGDLGGATITAYTDPLNSSDIWPTSWDVVVSTSAGTITFPDVPPHAQELQLSLVINGSWEVATVGDVSTLAFENLGGTLMAKHNGRVHLAGLSQVFGTETSAGLIAYKFPPEYRPLPPDIPQFVEHRLMVFSDVIPDLSRPVLAIVGGDQLISLRNALYRTTFIAAVDATALPPGAGDYGGFNGGHAQSDEPHLVYDLNPGATDVDGSGGFELSAGIHVSTLFPLSVDPNDPFETRPALYLCRAVIDPEDPSGATVYYKVVYNTDATNHWYTVWRISEDGSPVKLADTSASARPIAPYETGIAVSVLPTAFDAADDFGNTDGVVIRVHRGSFYEAFQDSDVAATAPILEAMPGIQAVASIISDPAGTAHWTGFVGHYIDTPGNASIIPWFPITGHVDVNGQGWHRGVGEGTIAAGDAISGVVRRKQRVG